MKATIFLFILFFVQTNFNKVNGQSRKIPFCEGMKLIQKAFQDAKVDELKDTVYHDNKYIFSSKIDIEEVTDEFVGTNLGTYYQVTYKATNFTADQEKFMSELVKKLEQCFDKKAKKNMVNGYRVTVGKVVFSAMEFGSKAIILSISTDE